MGQKLRWLSPPRLGGALEGPRIAVRRSEGFCPPRVRTLHAASGASLRPRTSPELGCRPTGGVESALVEVGSPLLSQTLASVRTSRFRPSGHCLPKGRFDQRHMKVGCFGPDALAQVLVQRIVSKLPFDAGQVSFVIFGCENGGVHVARASQLDVETVGIAMRRPRYYLRGEQSSIHGESKSRHASPNASRNVADGATAQT